MLVKGKNESHPFTSSDVPVSHADLQEAFLSLTEGESGTELFTQFEGTERERRFLFYEFGGEGTIYEYIQTGHASDEQTMISTGNVYNSTK